MAHYTYLIVGGGMTANAALKGIRAEDEQGSVGMISAEASPPYDRPPLTKGLWSGKKKLEKIVHDPAQYARVELFQGCEIVHLDPSQRSVEDQEGNHHTYDQLLLATGGTPRRLPGSPSNLVYYRTLEDYHRVREEAGENRRFTVIGGGFIGSEIAAALNMAGSQVSMVFPEPGIGANVYPKDISDFISNYYRQKGIQVLTGEKVSEIDLIENRYTVRTESGKELQSEEVIAGIGIKPNVQLGEEAGLKVDNGIQVDEELRAGPQIFAAGDVANFYNPALGERLRVEHEDNALSMGELAGRNMARSQNGKPLEKYQYLPYFYSDLFDLGYEAIGKLDSRLETFADWKEPFQQGVIYYLDGGRVRGVLLWNVWDQVPAARALIAEPGPFSPQNLKGRISTG